MSAQETRQENVSTYRRRDQNRLAITTIRKRGRNHDDNGNRKDLVGLCRQGKDQEAIARLYSPSIESVESLAVPGMEQTQRGIANTKGKNQWWVDNHEVHGNEAEGPFPHGDRFIVRFKYDVTPKHTGKRMTMDETGLYTVQNGKIVKEEFFYSM
jgi:ketosteroid isomerase-like protein